MKNRKKFIITLIFIISYILIFYSTISLGLVPRNDGKTMSVRIISKGVAILLLCLQILQYVVPILFFVIKLISNKRKQNGKNNFKNICLYLLISVVIGLVIYGIGALIIKNASNYGYSSKSADFIHYNGKIIYYHR